jgi:uncharacterized membrane protein YgcG
MTFLSRHVLRVALAASMAMGAAPATAQTAGSAPPVDPNWAPWMGCWQLVDESVSDRDASLTAMLAGQPAPRTRSNAGALVCVTPATAAAAATMTTLVNDRAVLTETIVADGAQRVLAEPDCEGWQRAEWSALGPRLFAQAQIACAGQPARVVSGLKMLVSGPTWVDVQMIESQGRKSLRVRRYQRAADQTHAVASSLRQAATVPLSEGLSIEAIKEAHAKVPAEALQAALLEIKGGFDINGKRLVELSEAGVPASIIDLMVALTFPEKLVVERRGSYSGGFSSPGFADYWPWYADPYFYTSFYAPFGYRYWGFYDPYYFSGPGFVVIDPGGVRPEEPQRSGTGRVVDGLGYTRVTTRPPERTVRSDGRGFDAGSSSSSGGSSSGSSGSSSGGVSSSGYSGGGGGGERTAQPRPPG